MKPVYGVLVVACGLAINCGQKAPAPGNPPPNSRDRDSCAIAEDCTLVQACCGCTAGGKQVAIRKDAVAEYDASRAARCGDTVCAQMIGNDPSCDAEAVCETLPEQLGTQAGHCKVAPHLGKAAP